ncbi:hypothetical protein ACU8OG_08725 [Rhizobium leguminosarum]
MTANWKLVVRTHKASQFPERRVLVEKAVLEAAETRGVVSAFSRTTSPEGQPTVTQTDGGLVCLISLDDLVDIVMVPPPPLYEVMMGLRQRSGRS